MLRLIGKHDRIRTAPNIEQSGTDTFSATYEVDQQIKEGEQTSNVKATYTVKVHVDADGDMVIVQNPTLAPAIEKSDYEPKTPERLSSLLFRLSPSTKYCPFPTVIGSEASPAFVMAGNSSFSL